MEFLRDFWLFLKERKKFWLIPLILVLLLIGILLVAAPASTMPFVYTLF
ncbi:MAG: DUF5989 family protein [Flavobacteriales bacterium]